MILLATSSAEAHSYRGVCDALDAAGAEYVVFLTDRVLSGRDAFTMAVSPDGRVTASYGQVDISPSAVTAGWHWKVNSFRVPGAEENVSRQMTMVNEITALNGALWSLYEDRIWINSPTASWRAERKLAQLIVAERVGFTIPPTVVSSVWNPVEEEFLGTGREAIVKMARGVIADQNTVKGMQTTRLDQQIVDELRGDAVPFPGIFQPLLSKQREWRVTVVGDELFAAAIYIDSPDVVDWREHQMSGAVRFECGTLPDQVAEACIDYLATMHLRYGAFDLVEQPDGQIVFLECNPSGQFSWLEERLGLPVSGAIANELVRSA